MSWTTLHMQVATPLFNGGADQSGAEIRVPSLRGAMRFWFRALAGVGIGRRTDDLLRLENHMFGSTEGSSPVKFRVPRQPEQTTPGVLDWPGNANGDGPWYAYLLGQGLTKLVRREEPGRRGPYLCEAQRPYVAAGTSFDLQLRFNQDDEARAAVVLAALWLMCTFGGLGARTRRGLGGLRILDVDGHLPAPWTVETLRSPDLSYYEQRYTDVKRLWVPDVVNPCMKALIEITREMPVRFDPQSVVDEGSPSYPMFSRRYAIAAVSGGKAFPGWREVFAQAGEELRGFRASEDYPEARYRPKIKTPEWARTIYGDDNRFGLGALGLPVNYKDSYSVQADKGMRGDDRLRRASPLWLRAVGEADRWRLLSFAFHGDFLPEDVDTHIWKGDRRQRAVTVTGQDVAERTEEWVTTMQAGGTFVRW